MPLTKESSTMKLKQVLNTINRRSFTNNTQKVAWRLLNAEGAWVSRRELERYTRSASARIRDLRKDEYGGFTVECESAVNLNKRGDVGLFFYRIRPNTVTAAQVKTVFNI